MKIRILETGEVKELKLISPKTKDRIEESYISTYVGGFVDRMPLFDFKWWESYFKDEQKLIDRISRCSYADRVRIRSIRDDLDDPEVVQILQKEALGQ